MWVMGQHGKHDIDWKDTEGKADVALLKGNEKMELTTKDQLRLVWSNLRVTRQIHRRTYPNVNNYTVEDYPAVQAAHLTRDAKMDELMQEIQAEIKRIDR